MLCVGLIAVAAGCSTFSAHSNVIEQVDGQKFTTQQFADIVTGIKSPTIQYNTDLGMFITTLWTNVTLFSQAVADNQLHTDSTLIAEALWPAVVNIEAARWMDTVVAHKAKVSDASVDSAYQAGQLRAVQHILIKADSTVPAPQRAAAKRKADSLLKLIRSGASFSQLAFENTEDQGSKADSGNYPLATRTQWVKPFSDALWKLNPGEVSGVVTTQFGYHIIRRPTKPEELKLWRDSLLRAASPAISQAYFPELGTQYHVKVASDAIPHMRAAIADMDSHQDDHTTLATYTGGTFTTADLIHWIRAMTSDPGNGQQELQSIMQAPDSEYTKLATGLTETSLLLQEAHKNGIKLKPEEWKILQTGFTAAVDSLKASLGLVPPALDPNASEHARSVEAAKLVDQYFKDLVDQKVPPKALPGVLAATLRARAKVHFNAAALQTGLEMARAKHSADSAKAGPATLPAAPPGMQPAPGGAPVPGGDTAKAAAPPPAPARKP
jgi:hypothetical protein